VGKDNFYLADVLQPVENPDNASKIVWCIRLQKILLLLNSTYIVLDLYSGETGAFRCLAAGKGEVAFIELKTIKENTGNSKGNFYLLLLW
jgi:hypothetical protein